MTKMEQDQVKSWMRKLARISQELNELAFQMADFNGGEYKTKEDTEISQVNIVKDVVEEHFDAVAEPVTELLNSKVANWHKKAKQLQKIIESDKTSGSNKIKASNSLRIIKGHISRHEKNNTQEGNQWKSQV